MSNHWLPYDETRLYRLLRIKRSDVWQQLRDDRHNLAQLAPPPGLELRRASPAALVAPWRAEAPAARLRLLRSRALRTLTQGHMAQHMFFHSLHQFAVPARARRIFGVAKRALPCAAPGRAQPDPDRDAVRALAGAGAGRGDRHPARALAVGRAHALDAGAAGPATAEPPGQPGAALAAAVALQRPAADAPPRPAPRDSSWRSRATTRRTRRSPPTAPASPTRPTSSACRWPSAPARSACSRRPPAGGTGHAGVRHRGRQPALRLQRRDLRETGASWRSRSRPATSTSPSATAGST